MKDETSLSRRTYQKFGLQQEFCRHLSKSMRETVRMSIQMKVTLEFEIKDIVRSYELVISGESFKEIKDRADLIC